METDPFFAFILNSFPLNNIFYSTVSSIRDLKLVEISWYIIIFFFFSNENDSHQSHGKIIYEDKIIRTE